MLRARGAIELRECTEEDEGPFFCIQCTMNVDDPLCRGIKLIVLGCDKMVHGETWGVIRYERSPFLCFYFGCIGHTMKNYDEAPTDLIEEEKDNLGYGTWPRVNLENSILATVCLMATDMDWIGICGKNVEAEELRKITVEGIIGGGG